MSLALRFTKAAADKADIRAPLPGLLAWTRRHPRYHAETRCSRRQSIYALSVSLSIKIDKLGRLDHGVVKLGIDGVISDAEVSACPINGAAKQARSVLKAKDIVS